MSKHDVSGGWVSEAAMNRIDEVRRRLIDMGWHCLSDGPFGLPSYSHVQAWGKGRGLIYLLYCRDTGGWDIVAPVDPTNSVENAFKAVVALGTRLNEEAVK